MSKPDEIIVTLPGGRRVDAQIRGHLVHTDQPKDDGGEDSAAAPFELFLASIGTCAGIFIQGFCAKRELPFAGIRILTRTRYATDGALVGVELDIEVPPDFPEKYRDTLVKVAQQCSVKKAIAAQPEFVVRARTAA